MANATLEVMQCGGVKGGVERGVPGWAESGRRWAQSWRVCECRESGWGKEGVHRGTREGIKAGAQREGAREGAQREGVRTEGGPRQREQDSFEAIRQWDMALGQ